jgi:hypothetical protein
MTKIELDDALRSRLGNLEDAVEVADGSTTVGYFLPKSAFYSLMQSPNDLSELRRRIEAGGGRPLKEIWADLRKQA